MAELLVVNTGPLIALSMADALDVAGKLPFEFICTPQVCDELAQGIVLGLPPIAPDWLRVVALTHPLPALARTTLDPGEAAVIQRALDKNAAWVCIDDWKGRRAALAVGLKVTGTLGLLLKAKSLNLVVAIRPIVDRLLHHGRWYHPELVKRILDQAGE